MKKTSKYRNLFKKNTKLYSFDVLKIDVERTIQKILKIKYWDQL